MKIGIYLGRYQPIHKGHLNTEKMAKKLYGFDEIILVSFVYKPYNPSYHFFLSFEEQKELAQKLDLKMEKFEIDLTKKYWSNLLSLNFLKKWIELRRIGGRNKKRYITRDWKELFPMSLLLLHPQYIPFRKGEREIRGSYIRELIYAGKMDEALKYLPDNNNYKTRLIEILKKKDINKIKKRIGYKLLMGFKIPPKC